MVSGKSTECCCKIIAFTCMMHNMRSLKSAKVCICAVKTDAFYVANRDSRRVRKVLDSNSNVGGWRAEDKNVTRVPEIYPSKHNKITKIPVYKSERLNVENEWDTESVCKRIIKLEHSMIRSKYVSATGKHLREISQTLFIVPQNDSVRSHYIKDLCQHPCS